ncbi:MAG TPA: class I SAM-dependent methyltransferase [Verrucomicrobiota bacterium]|nr:class I SAM-dependent methyltransferase [Verrucomicrobiota bacterium]HQL78235.1 class I SAM-dependent methyltransferase [Verrucomicrobiota bacterium]
MPVAEELGKAYREYYTHAGSLAAVADKEDRVGWFRRIYRMIKQGYLADKYGYEIRPGPATFISLGRLIYLLPLRRRQLDLEIRFLHARPEGRLLDLGCGSGQWLMAMRKLGWHVEGVDFDSRAAQAAAKRGLAIRCGALEQQNFPDRTFDAVTMSHVIEHLPDPLGTLTECARILKPGGSLVLWTPNTASLGHRLLKQHWRGLEPPRHLHLFAPRSIHTLLTRGGFSRISIRTHNSSYFWQQSFRLWARNAGTHPGYSVKLAAKLGPSLLAVLETALLVAGTGTGEWLDVHACRAA